MTTKTQTKVALSHADVINFVNRLELATPQQLKTLGTACELIGDDDSTPAFRRIIWKSVARLLFSVLK